MFAALQDGGEGDRRVSLAQSATASRQASGLMPSIGRSKRALAKNSGQLRINPLGA